MARGISLFSPPLLTKELTQVPDSQHLPMRACELLWLLRTSVRKNGIEKAS